MAVVQLVLAKGGIVQTGWKFAEPEELVLFCILQSQRSTTCKKEFPILDFGHYRPFIPGR